MIRASRILLTALVLGTSLVSATKAQAGCHGRSSGYSSTYSHYGRSYNHSPVVYSQPVFAKPVYSDSVYVQSQPAYVQSSQQYPTSYQYPQQSLHGPTQIASSSAFGVNVQSGSAVVSSQQFQSQQFGTLQPPPQSLPLSMVSNPIETPSSLSQSAIAPQAASPLQTTVPESFNDAQQSALQALGAFAPPASADMNLAQPNQIPTTAQNPVLGNWTASLSNGSRVQLTLQADGNFSWTALNQAGNTSTFQGKYVLGNGALTLSRSNDNQALTGSMNIISNNAFSFRLNDAKAASLDFTRN